MYSCLCSAQSVHANEARLEVLLARDAVMLDAYKEATSALKEISETDPEAYETLLSDLMLQGLIKLRDPEVLVRCREQDLDSVRDVLPAIPEMYLAAVGQPIELRVDSSKFLSDSACGGVALLSKGGRVVVENTFQSRLDIAYQQNMPAIRKILFQDM
jgi:V-type H+-transporting ATPase subunit E